MKTRTAHHVRPHGGVPQRSRRGRLVRARETGTALIPEISPHARANFPQLALASAAIG
jgi:hypothetical protein